MAEKLVLYVLTDTHYISEKMWEEGDPINNREKGDQIAIKSTPQILRTFFDKILADEEAKHVLITGDLINNGDKQSHLDFIEELKVLTDAGKRVYVTTATHDYAGEGEDGDENIFHATYYGKDKCSSAERVGKKDLLPLYYDFGPAQSSSVHETGSYSLPIQEGYRLIAINDNGNGRSHCGLFDEGFEWLVEEIRKAKANGELVFLAVHHPVIPPWEVFRAAADFEMFGGYQRMRQIMCEENVKIIFTGHTHVQGIKKYTDEQGRFFYDVTTTALPSANGKMRRVIFDKDAGTCDIRSIGIETIKGWDTKGMSAHDYISQLNFGGALEQAFAVADTDWEGFLQKASGVLPMDIIKKHPHLARWGVKKFNGLKMSTVAKLGGRRSGLTKEEKDALKGEKAKEIVFTVMDHIQGGNAPYTPDTPEYKALHGVTLRVDRLMKLVHFDLSKKLSGIHTLTEIADPFFYNTRTGDDDTILIEGLE